jgi:hypothetical protein
MNTVVTSFAVSLLLSSNAFAGNEGPAGNPLPHPGPRVIAQVLHEGAVVPRPVQNGIRILSTGEVVRFDGDSARVIARLEPETVATIVSEIDSLSDPGQLVDQNPRAPMCVGALPIDDQVTQSNGTTLMLQREISCHTWSPATYDGIADELARMLVGFDAIP